MAKIEKIYDAISTKKFTCVIPLNEVNERAEIEITKIAETAEIKGFRKGHVPAKMVKELYFAKAYNTAADNMIRETIEGIAKEHNFKLIASPSVKLNEEEKETVTFEVTFELISEMPEDFDFSQIKVSTYEVELTEKELDEELKLIAKKNKNFSISEASSEHGDIVVIDTVGSADGIPFAGGALQGHELELGSGAFIPGFEEQLIGKSANDKVQVNVTFPAEYHAESLKGKAAIFDTTVKAVKKPEAAEVNDELAKKLSFENVEAMKVQVSKKIHDFYVNSHKESLKENVFDQLAKLLKFEVSEGMVEKVMHTMVHERKMPHEEMHTLKGEATERMRLSMFLNFLADKHKIEAKDQDVMNFVIQSAMDSGMDPMQMIQFYQKNKEASEKLRILLEENKIFDFIFQKVTLNVEKISKEKFDDILGIKKLAIS